MDLTSYIVTFGYVGIFLTIFAESGVLIGFFLPGDSLLFTVALLASQGHLNIFILIVGCIVAAVLGDSFGYYLGHTLGPKIFSREDSWFFNKKHVEEARVFFEKHGKKSIILARFVPIVRTFIPIFAGVGEMNYRTFLSYNIIGGTLWAGGFLLVSYCVGSIVPGIDKYLTVVILGIVIVSALPIIIPVVKNYFTKAR